MAVLRVEGMKRRHQRHAPTQGQIGAGQAQHKRRVGMHHIEAQPVKLRGQRQTRQKRIGERIAGIERSDERGKPQHIDFRFDLLFIFGREHPDPMLPGPQAIDKRQQRGRDAVLHRAENFPKKARCATRLPKAVADRPGVC